MAEILSALVCLALASLFVIWWVIKGEDDEN